MSMNEYLLEFENLNHEITISNMKIPDTVLAFQMLEAGLNENHNAIIKETLLKVKDGKQRLRRSPSMGSKWNKLFNICQWI